MTTFSSQSGFSGIGAVGAEETFFPLSPGFRGIAVAKSGETFFALQKAFAGAATAFDVSRGRILLDGNLYTPALTVTISSTEGEYTVQSQDGYFVIYHFTDQDGNIVDHYAVVDAGIYVGFLNFTPSPAGIFTINLEASTGMAVKRSGAVVVPFIAQIPQNNFCYCKLECEYKELVFTDGGVDSWKNDKSSFIFQKLVPADTIAFELWKAGQKVADIVNSDYGQYYDFAAFASQPNYKAVILDWTLIWGAFGFGEYQFKAVQNITGAVSTFESRLFRLLPYADDLADGTVKIESYQNGNIIGSPFDFTGLNWYSSYRIAGKFSAKTPVLEVDNYVTSDYQKTQIQDKIRTEYTLQTKLLPSVVGNPLIYDQTLANTILITDYNVLNYQIYRQLPVRTVGVDATEYGQSRGMSFAVKFEEVTDVRKRNF